MARDVSLIIGGNIRSAEAALEKLQRSGSTVAHALERDFDALGTKSTMVFDAKRDAAKRAYANIKQSSLSSVRDIEIAERGLAKRLKQIDEEQYGKRLGLAKSFRGNLAAMAATAAVAGAGAVAYGAFKIGKDAVEQAGEFETALTDLGKVGVKDLGAVREAIMAMPDELGGATELVQGYYQAISAGVTDPKRAMDLLKTAAMAGKAAHVEQGEVIKALTKLMAGYGDELQSAEQASDLLFSMERFGQTNVAELVPVIGNLSAMSAQLKVMPYEMGAVVSAITQTAGSTAQAATQYSAIMTGLIKPTKSMLDLFEELGVDSAQQLISDQGLTGALRTIRKAAEDSFGPAGLGKVFESKEAITALGPLFADNFSQVDQTLVAMSQSAGATREAFEQYSTTFEALKDTFHNTVGKVMVELGTELMPDVKQALIGVSDWIRENKGEIIAFAKDLAAVIGTTARGIVTLQGNLSKAGLFGSEAADRAWASEESPSGAGESSLFPGMQSAYAVGTSYVPKTGLYQLHRGEQVVTRGEADRSQRSSTTIAPTFNITVHESQGGQATAREIARQILPELNKLQHRYA